VEHFDRIVLSGEKELQIFGQSDLICEKKRNQWINPVYNCAGVITDDVVLMCRILTQLCVFCISPMLLNGELFL